MKLRYLVFLPMPVLALGQGFKYQRPPEPIASVLEMPVPPSVLVSPNKEKALIVQRERYRTLEELAQPMLPLAGLRINPNNFSPARPARWISLKISDLKTGQSVALPTANDAVVWTGAWAPDGRHFAYLTAFAQGVKVWIVDANTGKSHVLPVQINATYGNAIQWMPDSHTLLVQEVPLNFRKPPVRTGAPDGPEVQEAIGVKKAARTYPDALRDEVTDRQFSYYMTSQLALVDSETGRSKQIGAPAIQSAAPSPDGKLLLITSISKPFSHRLYVNGFPTSISLLSVDTNKATILVNKEGQEGVPLEGVPTGPREHTWRSDKPETLIWVEAQDNGDPKKKVAYRDLVVSLDLLSGSKKTVFPMRERFSTIQFTETGDRSLIEEYDRDHERLRTYVASLDTDDSPALLSDISTREEYANPGSALTRELPNGHEVLVQAGDTVLFSGRGASPSGDRPFLDRVNIKTLKTERIWRCDEQSFEIVNDVLALDGSTFITRRESPTDPPNYYIHNGSTLRKITDYANPFPQLLNIKKQLVTYKRADGVPLSFTLYLPPDYKAGQRLPAIMDAYPLEFTDVSTAGQVTGSTKTFPIIRGHYAFLLAGYAVMDSVAMPIVGNPETVNDTYVQQLVDDTKAAIDKANELGVVDATRIGIMGHSYGAFMTANVLAHSDLVRAGAAESGAYNRTLTPFGFQSERRTFWQAPKMYMDVSPFAQADKIKHPILLIHGMQDDNPGTYTIQSQRFYDALAGNGATVRLVLLPLEAHGYVARESIEHVIWEELQWFDKYVKAPK